MQLVQGNYRIVTQPLYCDAPPDAGKPWRARVEIYHWSQSKPTDRIEAEGWFANCLDAERVALYKGVRAARTLPQNPRAISLVA